MRGNPQSPGFNGPATTFDLFETTLVAVGMVLALVTAVLVLSSPVVALAVVTAAVAVRAVAGVLSRVRVSPRTPGRTFEVRVPFTDLHVEL